LPSRVLSIHGNAVLCVCVCVYLCMSIKGECCDTTKGLFKSSGVVCRQAMHQCDIVDYCNGTVSFCPANNYKADGTPCIEAGPGGLVTYSLPFLIC
jgi:hypothetical protein